jgi:hypothetical protein
MAFSNGSLERSLVMRARVQDCRLSGLGRTRLCWAGRLAVTLFIALPITSLLFSWILGPVAIWILVDRELLVPIEAPECRCSSRACVAYRTTSVRNLPCQFAFCRAEHFYATGAVETNRVGSIEVKLVPLMISSLAQARAPRLQVQPSIVVNPDAFARRLLGTSTTAVVQRSALNPMNNMTNVTDGRQQTAAPLVRLL